MATSHSQNRITGLSMVAFVKKVILNVVLVSVVGAILPIVIVNTMDESYMRLLLTVSVSTISLFATYLCVGCTKAEREIIMLKIKK